MEILSTQNKIYNQLRRTYLDESDLKEGESFCSKCKGVGAILHNEPSTLDYTCPKCNGSGIVDWVEQIVGKPEPNYMFTDSSCLTNCDISILGDINISGNLNIKGQINAHGNLSINLSENPLVGETITIINRGIDIFNLKYDGCNWNIITS